MGEARTRHQLGLSLRDAERTAEAREHLTAAAQIFESLGHDESRELGDLLAEFPEH